MTHNPVIPSIPAPTHAHVWGHVLVVDDDAPLRDLLAQYLRTVNYAVSTAASAAEAEAQLAWLVPDVMVLDVMMPHETGIAFAQRLRRAGSHVPMLLLSARGAANDRIEGLEAGANDYLAKPFEPRELVLRLNNLMGRTGRAPAHADMLVFGAYGWSHATQQLTHAGEPVHLTEAERRVLHALATTPNRPVSREVLQPMLGGHVRQVDVLITRLRKKLEPEPSRPRYIETVRHAGYCLRASVVSSSGV